MVVFYTAPSSDRVERVRAAAVVGRAGSTVSDGRIAAAPRRLAGAVGRTGACPAGGLRRARPPSATTAAAAVERAESAASTASRGRIAAAPRRLAGAAVRAGACPAGRTRTRARGVAADGGRRGRPRRVGGIDAGASDRTAAHRPPMDSRLEGLGRRVHVRHLPRTRSTRPGPPPTDRSEGAPTLTSAPDGRAAR